MREAAVKRHISQWLTSIGAWHYPVMQHGYGARGVPDRCGIYKGKGFAIEVKGTTGEVQPWQWKQLYACERAGGLAIIARSLDDVVKAFEESGWI